VERKINGDAKSFTKVELYFTYAKFFDEDVAPKETMPIAILCMGKDSVKKFQGDSFISRRLWR